MTWGEMVEVPLTHDDPTFIMGSRVITKTTSMMEGCYWYDTDSKGCFKLRPDGTMRDSGASFEYHGQEYYNVKYLRGEDLFS